ncbi:MAG: metal-dependent hydrolase [Peptococcaceae bacterium]
MDNLTHGITGLGLAYVAQEIIAVPQAGLAVCAIISSQLPDLDVLIGSRGKTAYLKHHRGFSHSLFLAPLLAGFTAWGVKLFFPQTDYGLLFLISFLSLGLHLFLDLLNAYGTKLLWPFSQHRFALDILMIIDPLIIMIFVLGISLYVFKDQRTLLFALYPLLVLYILAMRNLRHKAKTCLMKNFPENRRISLLPPLLGWRNWNFILEESQVYYLGQIDAFAGQIMIKEKLSKKEECLHVRATKNDPEVQVFLEFARHPWFSKDERDKELVVKWSDLRYKLREREHFTIESKPILKP